MSRSPVDAYSSAARCHDRPLAIPIAGHGRPLFSMAFDGHGRWRRAPERPAISQLCRGLVCRPIRPGSAINRSPDLGHPSRAYNVRDRAPGGLAPVERSHAWRTLAHAQAKSDRLFGDEVSETRSRYRPCHDTDRTPLRGGPAFHVVAPALMSNSSISGSMSHGKSARLVTIPGAP
jgi:hypothetical protein